MRSGGSSGFDSRRLHLGTACLGRCLFLSVVHLQPLRMGGDGYVGDRATQRRGRRVRFWEAEGDDDHPTGSGLPVRILSHPLIPFLGRWTEKPGTTVADSQSGFKLATHPDCGATVVL
jgi:hypothetical protein